MNKAIQLIEIYKEMLLETSNKIIRDRSIDKKYFDAIKNGNASDVQNIVNSFAKTKMPNTKAVNIDGTLKYLYHQTDTENIDIFDLSATHSKSSGGRLEYRIPYAIYTKTTNEPIMLRGKNQYQLKLFLNIENPLIVEDRASLSMFLRKNLNRFSELEDLIISEREKHIKEIQLSNDPAQSAKTWNDKYEKMAIDIKKIVDEFFRNDTSYDCIIMNKDQKITSYIVFEPNRIKLADNITKDGNSIIPLSKRFDFSNSSIRY